jgi:ferredoxin-NADP reductase
MWDLQPGASLHIEEPFGAIHYSKPGLFLAAGTGITPFLSIFRDLWAKGELHNCSLLFSNKTKADIIVEHELTHYFRQQDNSLLLTLTRKSSIGYVSGRINEAIAREFCTDKTCFAYICGPRPFVQAMVEITKTIGIDSTNIITEK